MSLYGEPSRAAAKSASQVYLQDLWGPLNFDHLVRYPKGEFCRILRLKLWHCPTSLLFSLLLSCPEFSDTKVYMSLKYEPA